MAFSGWQRALFVVPPANTEPIIRRRTDAPAGRPPRLLIPSRFSATNQSLPVGCRVAFSCFSRSILMWRNVSVRKTRIGHRVRLDRVCLIIIQREYYKPCCDRPRVHTVRLAVNNIARRFNCFLYFGVRVCRFAVCQICFFSPFLPSSARVACRGETW